MHCKRKQENRLKIIQFTALKSCEHYRNTVVSTLPRWPHQLQGLDHFFQRRCPRNVIRQLIKVFI